MRKRRLISLVILGGVSLVQGCAPVVIAGGATAAVAATDRRTFGAFVDDGAIELKARRALNVSGASGDDVHVNITSVNGVVLLTGETTTAGLRNRVLENIRTVPGIRRIVNEIRVAEPTAFAGRTHDGWITGKVKAKLLGTENLESNQIKVVTENSVVYLMGLVKRQEADLAADAARSVSSVTHVVKIFEYLD